MIKLSFPNISSYYSDKNMEITQEKQKIPPAADTADPTNKKYIKKSPKT